MPAPNDEVETREGLYRKALEDTKNILTALEVILAEYCKRNRP